jgi:hypothetical protein
VDRYRSLSKQRLSHKKDQDPHEGQDRETPVKTATKIQNKTKAKADADAKAKTKTKAKAKAKIKNKRPRPRGREIMIGQREKPASHSQSEGTTTHT